MATATHTPQFVAHSREFGRVLWPEPRLELVVGVEAHEGPAYAAGEDALYFTTVPRGRETGFPVVAIARVQLDGERFPLEPERVSTVRTYANAANGMAIDRAGRLVVCEQGRLDEPARISVVDPVAGTAATLVEAHDGLPLNSPNDVVVASDGAVWFTDPSYGHLQGFRPAPQLPDAVYRYDPATDVLSVVADGFDKPNGLAFSPCERVLYVGDNGAPHTLYGFPVASDWSLGQRRAFAVAAPGHPDGLAVDIAGRIYASTSTGVQVLSPRGRLVGEIRLPGAVNFTFGGRDRDVLFITCDDAIWAASLGTKGA
jgi:gluconolactonase